MARVGGRNRLIAVPVGLICLAVVAGLLWLGIPGFRVIGDWIAGGAPTLTPTQSAAESDNPDAENPASDNSGTTGPITQCRDMYPDAVWSLFTLHPDAKLTQDVSNARTEAEAAVRVAEPQVQISCSWSVPGEAEFSTTVAQIAPEMHAVIEASLRGENFTCTDAVGDTHCIRVNGSMTEEHTIRGQNWIWQQLSGDVSADSLAEVTERILNRES